MTDEQEKQEQQEQQETCHDEEQSQGGRGWGWAFLLLGGIVGAVTMLSLTPWKGERVRNRLVEVSRSVRDKIQEYVGDGRKKTATEEGRVIADTAMETGRELYKQEQQAE